MKFGSSCTFDGSVELWLKALFWTMFPVEQLTVGAWVTMTQLVFTIFEKIVRGRDPYPALIWKEKSKIFMKKMSYFPPFCRLLSSVTSLAQWKGEIRSCNNLVMKREPDKKSKDNSDDHCHDKLYTLFWFMHSQPAAPATRNTIHVKCWILMS